MIAMDVVDELRHDEKIVERELDDDARRKRLIERLREIYHGQGIEVSDRILEEGVKALEEERFLYKPPKDGLGTRLAKIYVARETWGLWAIGVAGGIALLWLLNYMVYERPRLVAIEDTRIETQERLPSALQQLSSDILSEARDAGVKAKAGTLATAGLNAAKAGDLATARSAEAELKTMLARLREEFSIRIVSRPGESTGLWRIPDDNPSAYNYYIVVEALDRNGNPVVQEILNEETGKRERVPQWAVRVDRAVLDAVRADKSDDGIVQNSEAGVKQRGELEPRWIIPVAGGAITRW
jgi:hypothetical protein